MKDQFNDDIIAGILHKIPENQQKEESAKEADEPASETEPLPAPKPIMTGYDIWLPDLPFHHEEKK